MRVVVTGASGGIGLALLSLFEGHDLTVIGRQSPRGEKVRFIACDLGDLQSVARAAREAEPEAVDLLINNAGVAGRRGVSPQGFEWAFAVNYLSHYLLTRRLSPEKVIHVTSEAHRAVSALDPETGLGRTRSLLGWKEYAFSKACQVGFSRELADRGLNSVAVHPGVIATGIWRRVPQPIRWAMTRRMASPSAGALTVYAAQNAAAGDYVTPNGVRPPSPITNDPATRARLWVESEKWVADYL